MAKAPKPKFHLKFKPYDDDEIPNPVDFNVYRQPLAKLGDLVYFGSNRVMSAGTVGRLVGFKSQFNEVWAEIECLDGETRQFRPYYPGVIDGTQLQEVKDYYINVEQRPERIKVSW